MSVRSLADTVGVSTESSLHGQAARSPWEALNTERLPGVSRGPQGCSRPQIGRGGAATSTVTRTHAALRAGAATQHTGAHKWCLGRCRVATQPTGLSYPERLLVSPLAPSHHVPPLEAPRPATHTSNHTTPTLARVENMVSVHNVANTPRKAPEGCHGRHPRLLWRSMVAMVTAQGCPW